MTQHLTPQQLRAARGLLDWTREDLAKLAGVSVPTLHRFECGKNKADPKTQNKIRGIFEQSGVEFLNGNGVRLKQDDLEVYEGPERFNKFYDFLYQHMLERGGEVCLSVFDESLLAKYRTNPEIQRQRMRDMVQSKYVSYRVLVTKGDFTGDYVQYRQQPAHAAAPTAFYAFGECLALISFPNSNAPHVVVIRSEPLTQAYRQSFHASWEKAKPLSRKDIQNLKSA